MTRVLFAHRDFAYFVPKLREVVQVRRVIVVVVLRRIDGSAIAVPAQIERKDVIVRCEARRDEIEPVRVRGASVDTQHHGFPRRAIVEVMKPEPSGLDVVIGIRGGLRQCGRCAAGLWLDACGHRETE